MLRVLRKKGIFAKKCLWTHREKKCLECFAKGNSSRKCLECFAKWNASRKKSVWVDSHKGSFAKKVIPVAAVYKYFAKRERFAGSAHGRFAKGHSSGKVSKNASRKASGLIRKRERFAKVFGMLRKRERWNAPHKGTLRKSVWDASQKGTLRKKCFLASRYTSFGRKLYQKWSRCPYLVTGFCGPKKSSY